MKWANNSFRNPRTANALGTSAKYITNGRKPMLSMETALEIKRKREEGKTLPMLVKEYGVASQTITAAIRRAEFASGGA